MAAPKQWTPEEIKKLRDLRRRGFTFERIGEFMKVSRNCAYNALRKLGIHQPSKPSNTRDKILEECLSKQGKDTLELSHATEVTRYRVNGIVRELTVEGLLHRAGRQNFFRYFRSLEDAIRHEREVEEVEAKRKAEKREALQRNAAVLNRHKAALKRERLQRKKEALSTPIAEPKPKIEAPAHIVMYQGSVKVTVIPTPPSRFAFEPPEGWRGAITSDWMDRRLSQTGGNV